MEAYIHLDIFSLFYSIWYNRETKAHQIVKYLLENSPDNSRTWSIHVRHLARQYGLPDPLDLLNSDPMSKSAFKEMVKTKITAYHEKELRERAINNSKMTYFNVSSTGLTGRHHPAIAGAVTTHQVKKLRPAIKFLIGDYLTYQLRSQQTGGGGHCRLCPGQIDEDISHIVSSCTATSEIRERITQEIFFKCQSAMTMLDIDKIRRDPQLLTQLILDCTSLNLENGCRIHINDPIVPEIFKLTRDLCHAVHSQRLKLLKKMESDDPLKKHKNGP